MKRISSMFASLGAGLAAIHPVDKGLLLFMVALLLQSVYSIFSQTGPNQISGDIDIIVRTSTSAIFGYFLSANFTNRTAVSQAAHAAAPVLMTAAPPDSGTPKNQIGFTDKSTALQTGSTRTTALKPQSTFSESSRLQIVTITAIGLFCLLTLLFIRNIEPNGDSFLSSDSATATIVQFRDFVSGCVGYLIGYPSWSQNQSVSAE